MFMVNVEIIVNYNMNSIQEIVKTLKLSFWLIYHNSCIVFHKFLRLFNYILAIIYIVQ